MIEFYRNEHPLEYNTPPYWGGGSIGGSDPFWIYGSENDNDDNFGLSFETDGPVLRLSPNGILLMCGPYLLKGSLSCPVVPMIVYIDDGDETQNDHWDCVLMKFSDEARELTVKRSNSKQIASYCFFDWNTTGKFKLKAKWQAGHYNHAEISRVRFVIFGVSTDWKTLPLTAWVDVAEIDIRADGGVYVSGFRGSADGNTQFLE